MMDIFSTGKGASLETRLWSALMEVCERIVVMEARPDFVGTACEIAARGLPVVRPAIAHGESPFETRILEWSLARENAGGQQVYIPRFHLGSNGAAGGQDFLDAAERGLLELVERDALMTTWLAKRSAPRVLRPWDSVSEEVGCWLAEWGMSVELRLISTDIGLPVILAVATQVCSGPPFREGAVLVGCACSGTVEQASQQALLEAVQALEVWLHSEGDLRAWPAGMRWFVEDDRRSDIRFFGEATCGFSDAPRSFAPIDHVRHLGWNIYVQDRTPLVLRELGVALVEVVVPGLQPLLLQNGPPQRMLVRRRFGAAEQCSFDVPHPLG